MTLPIEPNDVVRLIEEYIEDEHVSAEKWENRTPLDEAGISHLHSVAAEVYALGFHGGTCVANERNNRRRDRERAARPSTAQEKP
ncbi:hypothetical protein [Rhodococcus sp. 1168]|uniref:hypothetical protein n=1 Tax=Rhodococcus sp. 1168 TaxID=2018041 RepID=UPI000A0D5C88|nr:hypothetical protein [Rhodococcus sp. 1168]ORI13454.1 hypothetical protein BJI47_22690 [Rhodococcus sp. 1168]